jgi:FHS family L-fucose permease-like MFS transporter
MRSIADRGAVVLDADMKATQHVVEPRHLFTFGLISSMFFAWGLAANMTDTLLAAFKRILSLSDFQTTFVQYAYFGAYFCFAIPASLLVKRFGYKAGILVGLGLYIAGALLFHPASVAMRYESFLLALYVLAAGLSILETSANPYVYALGSAQTATQRLNLAQSFNPIGAITGALLGKLFILGNLHHADAQARAGLDFATLHEIQSAELAGVMSPYVGVACVLLLIWLIIAVRKIPAGGGADSAASVDFAATAARLLRRKRYMFAVGTQFVYVGAQVGIWSFTIRYVMDRLGVNEAQAASYYTASLVLFFVSRFVCTWLMSVIRAEVLLGVLAVVAAALSLIAAFSYGKPGVYTLIGVSGCMSLMFPTIYGMGLAGLGADAKLGGAGLVMAIVGGAIVTGFQGVVSDRLGDIGKSFVVPAVCFVTVAIFAFTVRGTTQRDAHPIDGVLE